MLTKDALKVTMLYIQINKEVHTMNKKKIDDLIQQELIEAVGYLRLSRDDGEDESTSITNQRAIITDWAAKNGFIITKWYTDDGYSGYSLDRPGFNELKEDLNNGKVKVIIAKHLSRIGRRGSAVNLFLETIQEDGNRVITISDGYDTFDERTHEMLGIHTWVNEKYIKDTSKSIRAAIDRMQKEGRFICQVPYGYELDPFVKGKYYVDKTCAIHVQEIFDLYLNGYGSKAIAKILTERKIPTYWQNVKTRMERRGQVYKGRNFEGIWTANTILKILRNDFYIGVLTLGKTKRRTINGKRVEQKEEDLIRFEDAHEPIIDKQTFKLAQEIMAERTHSNYRGSQKGPTVFSGKLFCADCGTRLTSASSALTQRYVCRKYHLLGTEYCTSHSTNDRNLTAALIYFLGHCRDNLAEAISDLKIMSNKTKDDYQRDGIAALHKDQERIEKEIAVLIEQKMRETMDNPTLKEFIDKTYANMINSKYLELQSISTRIDEIEEESSDNMDIKKELTSVLAIFDEILTSKTLNRRQVETIVEKIIVHEDDGLDIYLKGDLHELCTNYIQFKSSNKEAIVEEIIKYFETHADEPVLQKRCEKYVRAQGIRFDTIVFAKLFNNLVDAGYVERISQRKGCKATDINKLKQALRDDTVMAYTTRCQKLSVTIQFLHKVCKWYKDTKPKYKKY